MAFLDRLTEDRILNAVRRRVLAIVTRSPGVNYVAVRDALGVSNHTATHHLAVLEAAGHLRSVRVPPYRRYYPAETFEEADLRRDAWTRNPEAGGVYEAVVGSPGAYQTEIATRFPAVTRQTIGHHLARLVSVGALRAARDGKRVRYWPVTGVAA